MPLTELPVGEVFSPAPLCEATPLLDLLAFFLDCDGKSFLSCLPVRRIPVPTHHRQSAIPLFGVMYQVAHYPLLLGSTARGFFSNLFSQFAVDASLPFLRKVPATRLTLRAFFNLALEVVTLRSPDVEWSRLGCFRRPLGSRGGFFSVFYPMLWVYTFPHIAAFQF